MKKYLIVIVILQVVLFTHCGYEKVSDLDFIKKSWQHSYEEENTSGTLLYRPCDYKEFPPSRFRQYFEFKDNYVCVYLVLSETDGHYTIEGTWKYNESTNIVTITNETDVVFEFKILELKKNILKIEML